MNLFFILPAIYSIRALLPNDPDLANLSPFSGVPPNFFGVLSNFSAEKSSSSSLLISFFVDFLSTYYPGNFSSNSASPSY